MARFIRFFRDLTLADLPLVGGKNASLGEMVRQLAPRGVHVPKWLRRHGRGVPASCPTTAWGSRAWSSSSPSTSAPIRWRWRTRSPEFFQAVGQFYREFPQVEGEEVVKLLALRAR